jgi:tripartite-type tricarboxylate transporter receptor subunit TctC
VVVENRVGGESIPGTLTVARAPADGYSLLLVPSQFTVHPHLRKDLPYDVVKDFAPVILLATSPVLAAANNHLGISSIKELVASAKANPGKHTYGSGGVGSVSHLSVEIFKAMAGIDILHVPYKGGGDFQADMIAGRIDFQFNSAPTVAPHVKSGRMKALAVTSTARSRVVPELPTVSESGLFGYEYSGWYGLWVPVKTPAAVIGKINGEFNRALQDAVLRERFHDLGIEPHGGSAEQFAVYLAAEFAKWAKVARAAKIKME